MTESGPATTNTGARGLVVFIDDELLSMYYYVEAIRRCGFAVKQFFGPRTAVEWLRKHPGEVTAIVLDIMMPNEDRYQQNQDGMSTGWLMLQEIAGELEWDNNPSSRIPIIVLSNAIGRPDIGTPPPDVTQYVSAAFEKLNCSLLQLAAVLDEIVRSSRVGLKAAE